MLFAGPGSSSGGRAAGRGETREWSRPGLVARQMALNSKPKTLRVSLTAYCIPTLRAVIIMSEK